jgi:hypothetical protein
VWQAPREQGQREQARERARAQRERAQRELEQAPEQAPALAAEETKRSLTGEAPARTLE